MGSWPAGALRDGERVVACLQARPPLLPRTPLGVALALALAAAALTAAAALGGAARWSVVGGLAAGAAALAARARPGSTLAVTDRGRVLVREGRTVVAFDAPPPARWRAGLRVVAGGERGTLDLGEVEAVALPGGAAARRRVRLRDLPYPAALLDVVEAHQAR